MRDCANAHPKEVQPCYRHRRFGSRHYCDYTGDAADYTDHTEFIASITYKEINF